MTGQENAGGGPLATWTAPAWATSSLPDGSGVSHAHVVEDLSVLDLDGADLPFSVCVSQLDVVSVDAAGAAVVTREGVPVVLVEGLRLSLAQADAVGRALVGLAERCGL